MDEIQNVMQKYESHAKALAAANAVNKAVVFEALSAASITEVTVTFDGGGDSGQIGEITVKAGDKPIPLPAVQITMQRASWNSDKLEPSQIVLRDAIEELCFDFLSQEHEGWENNDGGSGQFTFDISGGRIELDFDQFFTDSTNHYHEF